MTENIKIERRKNDETRGNIRSFGLYTKEVERQVRLPNNKDL